MNPPNPPQPPSIPDELEALRAENEILKAELKTMWDATLAFSRDYQTFWVKTSDAMLLAMRARHEAGLEPHA